MLWLALYFPQLPLEAFTASSYIAQTQIPQVVLEQNRVHLANNTAISAGIVPGCSLATAHSIAPSLQHFRRDSDKEYAALKHLAESLYAFSSLVSLETPDSIVLEIQGSSKLFTQTALLTQASSLCENMGYTCITAMAQTATAAITCARSQSQQLHKAPLNCCGLEHQNIKTQVIEQLANMGLHTLGALIKLPRDEIAQRFGNELTVYLDKLEGKRQEPRKAIQLSQTFERKLHLLQPIKNKQQLLDGPMLRLSLELQQWLIAHQLGCQALTWRFIEYAAAASSLRVRFTQSRQQHQEFLSISRLQLEQATLPSEVLSIELKLTLSAPWLSQAKDLFASSTSNNNQRIEELIDALTARLGPQACQQIHSGSRHTPEHAWQFNTRLQSNNRKVSTETTITDAPSRPLWLLPKPHPIKASALQLLQGPERIQSEWWLQSEARDYYIARHSNGAMCWVYQCYSAASEQHSDVFFLHGYFA